MLILFHPFYLCLEWAISAENAATIRMAPFLGGSPRSNNALRLQTLSSAKKQCPSRLNNVQSGRILSKAAKQCSSPKTDVQRGFRLEKRRRGRKKPAGLEKVNRLLIVS
jgi:hypothetical protein